MHEEHDLNDAATCNTEYFPEEVEFALAMDRFKRENHVIFPTCRETLRVLASLGYRQTEEPTELPVRRYVRKEKSFTAETAEGAE
jgi:hypothetical protein